MYNQYGQPLYPQQTGYPIQQPPQQSTPQFMQAQMTGFPLQAQQTGYLQPSGYHQPQRIASMPAMPHLSSLMPQPTAFQGSQQRSFLSPMNTGMPSQQPQQSAVPIQVPSMFTQSFLPAASMQQMPSFNMIAPQQMQFNQPSMLHGQSLSQVYQQQVAQQPPPPVPWSLSADERKNYDSIFRAWDPQGSGFISGNMAKEVFGQSGIERDELMQIWNLADTENRGKLNLAEFHVAMGLIYRRLNGNPIPATLPPELVPPSAKDLGQSVDFLKDLLRNDTNARSTGGSYGEPASLASIGKSKSLHVGPTPATRKDGTAYKHDDSATSTYKSSSRHLDRSRIRAANDTSETSDLDEIKRQLDDSQAMLDKARSRDAEDDALQQEKEDLLHAIRRIQSDIEHNSRGRRTEAKESERRRLDRELDRLKHEQLPDLQAKIEANEKEKARQNRRAAIERDSRNDSYSRFADDRSGYRSRYDSSDDRHGRASRGSIREEDDEEEQLRGYQRGTFEGRTASRPSRTPSPPPLRKERTRSPAPNPPAVRADPPKPAPSPKPAMSAEDRAAFIKAEAAKRVQDRLVALGIAPPSSSSSPVIESSATVQKPSQSNATADQEAEERARQRQLKLERERLKDDEKDRQDLEKAEKEIVRMSDQVTAFATSEPQKQQEAQVLREALDEEEAVIAAKEAALAKAKAERLARIKQLEEEERQAQLDEAEFQKRKNAFSQPPAPSPQRKKAPPVPPSKSAPRAKVEAPVQGSLVNQPQASVVASVQSTQQDASQASFNPFHRPQSNNPSTSLSTPASALGINNPFNRNRSPAPPLAEAVPSQRPKTPVLKSQEDWDVPTEKDASDSSEEDEPLSGRRQRQNLANSIFGGIMPPTNRPTSSASNSRPQTPVSAPPAPPAPQKAMPIQDTGAISGKSSNAALLGQIQGGLTLKKTKTNDRSGVATAGSVLESIEPTSNEAPRPSSNRDSVDWVTNMASTQFQPSELSREAIEEEAEDDVEPSSMSKAATSVGQAGSRMFDAVDVTGSFTSPQDNVDRSTSYRARTLYAYKATDRPDDLEAEENVIVLINPALDGEDWVFGTIEDSGASGWLPSTYIAKLHQPIKARAVYEYTATAPDELDLQPDHSYSVVDNSEEAWWRVEHNGRALLAPAAYLEEEPIAVSYVTKPTMISHLSDSSAPPSDSEPEDLKVQARDVTKPTMISHLSDSSAPPSDSEPEDLKVQARERERVLQAAGILQRSRTIKRRRKAPLPPRHVSTEISPVEETEEPLSPAEFKETTDDAYDRWIALQRDLPPMPVNSNRSSLIVPLPSSPSLNAEDITSTTSKEGRTSGFFSRLASSIGRSSSPNTEVRKVINVVHTSSDATPTGPTWSSLIDNSALVDLPDMERKRQESIFELITTEQQYVQNLQLIVNEFLFKLQPLVDEKALNVIFGNIEDILLFNTTFLSDLEARQKEARLYISNIGDVVAKHMNGLQCYRPYCTNQANAGRFLDELNASRTDVKDMLASSKVNNLGLEDFLLQPMQRLTRYPLLFGQILRYTNENEEDYSILNKCLADAQRVLTATNESIREEEDLLKLQTLSDTLLFDESEMMMMDLTAPSRLVGKRRIIKEGTIWKKNSTKKLYGYLLSDVLLLTRDNSIYRTPLFLEEISTRESRDEDCFTIQHLGASQVYKTSSARVASEWLRAIEEARQNCVDAARKAVGVL